MNYRDKSIFREIYYQPYKKNQLKLYDYAKDDVSFIQRLGLIRTLPLHQGCVNTLCWNEAGNLLLSGSDDQHLVVTNGHTYEVLHNYRTSHRANIFSAKFMPASCDHNIVSCSGDGIILYTDLERPSETYYNQFNCHSGTTYEVITIPNDPHTFLSCGEDGTVRWFDLRIKSRCKKPLCKDDILILHHRAVSALNINPVASHQLAIGSSDSTVRIYDRRMLSTADTDNTKNPVHNPICSFVVPELEERTYRITSLSYSPDGQDMLVSYSSDHLYLFRIQEQIHTELVKSQGNCKSQRNKHKQATSNKRERRSPPPVRRLRLRGDWSDTGPDARPERDATNTVSIGQARPQLQATLMERMTNVLFRMLNDPLTRAALSAGGEDSLETNSSSEHSQEHVQGAVQQEESSEPQENIPEEQPDSMNEETSNDMRTEEIESLETSTEIISPSTSNLESQVRLESPNFEGQVQVESPNLSNPESLVRLGSPKPSCSVENPVQEDNNFNNLHNQLSTLRDGFIEKHGSEPTVSLRYSDQSYTNSTIKLGVGDELNRSSFNVNAPSSSKSSEVASQSQSALKEKPSTSCDNRNNERRTTIVETEMDINVSTDELLLGQDTVERLSSDVELDYSDSDDEHKEIFKNNMEAIINRNAGGHTGVSTFEPHVKQKYVGHRNARTMIKEATFWGNNYVMSGSDCGHVFVWDRATAKLVMLLQADHHVVNCLQPHPTLPLLATSGIDHDVKIWAPILEEDHFDIKMAEDLMKRNEVMLEETRDTITVPAAFMIRMLACLNQIRRTGSLSRSRRREESEPDA